MKMDARPPVLAAERLTVQVGRRDVCHELDFTLQAGDTLVVVYAAIHQVQILVFVQIREMNGCEQRRHARRCADGRAQANIVAIWRRGFIVIHPAQARFAVDVGSDIDSKPRLRRRR